MAIIDLTPEEFHLLLEGLDAFEYWEHKDDLPHGSGFIYDPDMMVSLSRREKEEIKASDAWKEVEKIRALFERLDQVYRSEMENDSQH